MFYRVDYALAVLSVGFLAGLLCSRRTEDLPPSRLAQAYYAAVAILLVLRTAAFAGSMLTTGYGRWGTAGGLIGDILGLLFGALFGLAMRRKDGRAFLLDANVLAALCMGLAFTFASVGVGKAFSMTPMTEFFTQSGYSVPFLKFIVIAEIFGGIGLLLPWAFLPALVGLTIDMFGAVLTHVHNGDPLNDSSDAIVMLIRLAAVAVLWAMRPRAGMASSSLRTSMAKVATAGVICLLIAIGGSVAMRHFNPPATAIVSPIAH
jgi:hypothetical protein